MNNFLKQIFTLKDIRFNFKSERLSLTTKIFTLLTIVLSHISYSAFYCYEREYHSYVNCVTTNCCEMKECILKEICECDINYKVDASYIRRYKKIKKEIEFEIEKINREIDRYRDMQIPPLYWHDSDKKRYLELIEELTLVENQRDGLINRHNAIIFLDSN